MFFLCFVLNIWIKPFKGQCLWWTNVDIKNVKNRSTSSTEEIVPYLCTRSQITGLFMETVLSNGSEVSSITVTWYKFYLWSSPAGSEFQRNLLQNIIQWIFQIAWNGIYQTLMVDQDCANWSCQTTHPNCHMDNWILTVHIALVDMPKFTMDCWMWFLFYGWKLMIKTELEWTL